MPETDVLREAAEHAIRLYADLDHDHVAARAGYEDLVGRFRHLLPETGMEPTRVLSELLTNARGRSRRLRRSAVLRVGDRRFDADGDRR